MLHAAAHLNEIAQDVCWPRLARFHIHATDGDEEVEARQDERRLLHALVEGEDACAAARKVRHVHLEEAELGGDSEVDVIVRLGREGGCGGRAQFRRELGRDFDRFVYAVTFEGCGTGEMGKGKSDWAWRDNGRRERANDR